ncbi:MAG: acyl-CoA thioesterase, partial [Flavobacteriales bacterium]
MQEFDLPTAQVYTPEIRFVDIDAAGIVNNATYFNYFEQSRIAFFEPLLGKKWDWNAAGMVVARHEIDYRAPILFNDDVRIVTWIEHIGTKSMTAAYEVYKHWQGERVLVAQAKTVLV